MILFYTGALKSDELQLDQSKSLGGYFSSSIVPNGVVSNIFSELTNTERLEKSESHRCIGLKNTFVQDVNNVSIYVDTESDSRCRYELGVQIELFTDNCDNVYTEIIQTERQLPYYVQFETYDSNTPLVIPTILPGQMVALWIKRVPIDITPSVDPLDTHKSTCMLKWESLMDELESRLDIEGFNLHITW